MDYEAPLSMGFSRQEYWGGLPFTYLRDLPNHLSHHGSPEYTEGLYKTDLHDPDNHNSITTIEQPW